MPQEDQPMRLAAPAAQAEQCRLSRLKEEFLQESQKRALCRCSHLPPLNLTNPTIGRRFGLPAELIKLVDFEEDLNIEIVNNLEKTL